MSEGNGPSKRQRPSRGVRTPQLLEPALAPRLNSEESQPSLEQWVEQITRGAAPGSGPGNGLSQPPPESSDSESETDSGLEAHADEQGMNVMKELLRKEQSERLKGGLGGKRKRSSAAQTRIDTFDPIDLGMVSEAHGLELFNFLRRASPFSISVILFVGQKIQDAGRPDSELQRKLREHAETIGGVDMELYKCLPQLASRVDLEESTPKDVVSSRSLVVGARLWLLACKVAIDAHHPLLQLVSWPVDPADASILVNSALLRHVRSPGDVARMPVHRKAWLLSSLEDSKLVVTILGKELLHANHYSHVALASVGRVYMRLATLFPEHLDLRRTAKDLTQLAEVLAHRSPRLDQAVALPPSSQSPFDFDLFAAEHLLNQELGGLFGPLVDTSQQNTLWLDMMDPGYSLGGDPYYQ
ncbi:hypothetical protein IAU60_005880 [Kwoniella sp. DSM 27419]